jgi:hypothetical protein
MATAAYVLWVLLVTDVRWTMITAVQIHVRMKLHVSTHKQTITAIVLRTGKERTAACLDYSAAALHAKWLTAVQSQHHLMLLTMEPYWSLQEFVETMGVVSANLEVALDAPVIQAILGNIAMKTSMTASRTLVRMEAHVWTKLIHTSVYAKKAGREKSAAAIKTNVPPTHVGTMAAAQTV